MTVLYFNPNAMPGTSRKAITERGHNVVSAAKSADALQLVVEDRLDAIVIENEQDLEFIDFTIEVHRIRPTLPVFLTSDWGPDLPLGLEDLASGALATH